jgi:penicillin G amidase
MRARQLRIGPERPGRPFWRAVNIIAAVCVSALLLGVLGFGYATIPALGPALDPGHGVWTSAAGGEPVRSETLQLPGLRQPVMVTFTGPGAASISAASTHDVFLALGYVHARFRLSEMDEERRLGEGRLAQLAGPTDLASDKFELELGLLRTAEQEWAQMPKASAPAQALIDYAEGVNDDIAQVRASGQWPAVFSLPGVYPGPWTPVDSLVIQGELSQELDFTTTPLDYALLERSLGPALTMAWFPIIAKNAQTPYDPGPYPNPALTPLAPGAASTLTPASPVPASPVPASPVPARPRSRRTVRRGQVPRPVRVSPRPKRRRRARCSPSSASCPRGSCTNSRTATRGRPTGPRSKAAAPCSPVTRTCRRRCRRSGTRSPCPRRAWTWPGSACRACPGSSSGTTLISPGR